MDFIENFEKLFDKNSRFSKNLLLLVLGATSLSIWLFAENTPVDEIKNFGNTIILMDENNVIQDLSFIPFNDSMIGVGDSVTITLKNENGNVISITHAT